jgi:hypothetical protein
MKKMLLSVASLPFIIGGLSAGASAADGFNLLDNVKVQAEIRPRYESADIKDNGKDSASAATARTSIGVGADLFQVNGLSTYLEGTSVNNFSYDNYNSTSNGKTKYDVIKDPQQARMTQAYIDYKIGKTLVRAGRQMVNIDNQRFIGAVGWRQMFQTFDAVAVVDNSIENLSLLGAYVYGINSIGEDAEATDTGSVLLHAAYKVNDMLTVTAYDYMLSSISDTYGIALTGNIAAGPAKLDYRAEYANQVDASLDYKVKDVKASANYYNLDLGANISGILAGVNYEVLSGKKIGEPVGGDTAFSTPLATLHGFNGWADVFLATPSGGLEDANVRLGYATEGFGKVLAVYHTFTSGEDMAAATGNSTDLGTEFDAVYANKIPGVNGLSGLIKGAFYQAGEVTGYTLDKTVAWVQLDYKFSTK